MTHYGNFGGKPPSRITPYLLIAFCVGLGIGLLVAFYFHRHHHHHQRVEIEQFRIKNNNNSDSVIVNDAKAIRTVFLNNSYSSVSFVDNGGDGFVEDGVFWGRKVEEAMPKGYQQKRHDLWSKYLEKAVAVKMENGCGRMQNRMVVFQDGAKGCVRYRQNTDQIQGELFSFYLAQLLKLPNLAPSAISVVDLSQGLWANLRSDIASAQWNSNKPIVVTQFIPGLTAAYIPPAFKPTERHLNRLDVVNMSLNLAVEEDDLIKNFVELAQWSDLIIFDYLTANLDRIVNNLYNYQWNVNIMDAPAHNLAKKSDSDLLIFLDNESGLLHGYRLLKKYEIYHSVLLENLCLFRRPTADIIKHLKINGNVGQVLRNMFDNQNGNNIKDILPTLPDKSVKILNERIDKVYNQITKCESMFTSRST